MAIKSSQPNTDLNSVLLNMIKKMGFDNIPISFFSLKENLSDGTMANFQLSVNEKQIDEHIFSLRNEIEDFKNLKEKAKSLKILDNDKLL